MESVFTRNRDVGSNPTLSARIFSITERTPRDIRETEADAVSLLCCESLGLPEAEYSRGHIQSWGQGQAFSERSAQRIFRAADQILRAGYPGE